MSKHPINQNQFQPNRVKRNRVMVEKRFTNIHHDLGTFWPLSLRKYQMHQFMNSYRPWDKWKIYGILGF